MNSKVWVGWFVFSLLYVLVIFFGNQKSIQFDRPPWKLVFLLLGEYFSSGQKMFINLYFLWILFEFSLIIELCFMVFSLFNFQIIGQFNGISVLVLWLLGCPILFRFFFWKDILFYCTNQNQLKYYIIRGYLTLFSFTKFS